MVHQIRETSIPAPKEGVAELAAQAKGDKLKSLKGQGIASQMQALAPQLSGGSSMEEDKPDREERRARRRRRRQRRRERQAQGKGQYTKSGKGGFDVHAKYDNTQISEMFANGQRITEGEGFYIIGSETGEDRPDQNVRSPDSNGSTLFAPGEWPGAPFRLEITGNNPYHVKIQIGPMPTKYQTLSVPFDLRKDLFDTFRFSGSEYEVGAGNSWQKKKGNGGKYKDVPQPAHIEGHGNVGVAKTKINGPGFWAEVSGATARVRRTVLGGSAKEMHFYHHPYTHNIEINFGSVPKGGSVWHEEKLEILPVNEAGGGQQGGGQQGGGQQGGGQQGGGQQGGPPVSSNGQQRLNPLYKGLLGRAPDPAGIGTFSPEVASGLAGMHSVAHQMLASPEFAARRSAMNDVQLLDSIYQGFFGRKLDSSGQGTFTPWLAQGRTTDVVDALLDSTEFRTRFGL